MAAVRRVLRFAAFCRFKVFTCRILVQFHIHGFIVHCCFWITRLLLKNLSFSAVFCIVFGLFWLPVRLVYDTCILTCTSTCCVVYVYLHRYTRDLLLSLRNSASLLDRDVRLRIKSLITYRGCHAGRRHRQSCCLYRSRRCAWNPNYHWQSTAASSLVTVCA